MRRLLPVMLVLIVAFFADSARTAECPPVPDVFWWKTDHQKMVEYVGRKYGGEWEPYVAKWLKYRDRMKDILGRGSTASLKSYGVKLEGAELADYIAKIEDRIEVTRCLARNPATATPPAAAYQCPEIPEVAFWGDVTHKSIADLVEARFGGDWRGYIETREDEMADLMRSFEKGEEVVVSMFGFTLDAEELGLYVNQLARFIAITYCLADDAANGRKADK